VGWALASLPHVDAAPWWRVVRSDGTLPNPRFAAEQRKRLAREGIRFTSRAAVDLRRYGWPPA
jgi:alkylated DNA nucleotide flippase Atl1